MHRVRSEAIVSARACRPAQAVAVHSCDKRPERQRTCASATVQAVAALAQYAALSGVAASNHTVGVARSTGPCAGARVGDCTALAQSALGVAVDAA